MAVWDNRRVVGNFHLNSTCTSKFSDVSKLERTEQIEKDMS